MPVELKNLTDDEATIFIPEDKKNVVIKKNMVSENTWNQLNQLQGRLKPFQDAPKIGSAAETKQKIIKETVEPALRESEEYKAAAPEEGFGVNIQPTVAQPQQPMMQQPATAPVMQATTTQIQREMMGPEYKEALKSFTAASQEVAKTSEETAKLEIEKQKQLSAERMRVEQIREDDMIEYESERLMREANLQKRLAKVDEAEKKFQNFEYRDYFEGSTGAKVMAGIAMALGAVGAAITKGENTAFKIIQNAIDSDMRMQQAQHDKLKGAAQEQRTLYSQLVAQGLDESEAFLTGVNIRYKQGIDKLDAMASQISDPEAQAKLAQLKATMQQEMAAKQADAVKGFNIKSLSETKPMVLPSAKEQAQSGREIEEYVNKTPIKEAADAYQGLQEFKNAIANGATPQAIASFIASNKGLGQGSYGPLFEQMLKEQGLVDRTVEGLTEYFQGTKPETLVRSIENFLESKSIEAGVRAQPYIGEFEKLNIQAGRPPDLYTRQINPRAFIKGKARGAGLRPVGEQ